MQLLLLNHLHRVRLSRLLLQLLHDLPVRIMASSRAGRRLLLRNSRRTCQLLPLVAILHRQVGIHHLLVLLLQERDLQSQLPQVHEDMV